MVKFSSYYAYVTRVMTKFWKSGYSLNRYNYVFHLVAYKIANRMAEL